MTETSPAGGPGTTYHMPVNERAVIRAAMTRATTMLKMRTGRSSIAFVAEVTGTNESTAKAYLSGLRRPSVTFVRVLAERAGIPVTELFLALGWLPAVEAAPLEARQMAEHIVAAAGTLRRLEPYARRILDRTHVTTPAIFVAIATLLADLDAASRFHIRLFHTVSGGRYPMITSGVAEFSLRPGCRPRSTAELDRLVHLAGDDWRPDPAQERADPAFWAVRRELRSAMYGALSDADTGLVTWHGDPGTRAWSDEVCQWPGHLLAQDPYGGVPRPGHAAGWRPGTVRTVVVVGDPHSAGAAAAVLAEGLGWEFLPVQAHLEFDTARFAWDSVAREIQRRHNDSDPWRVIVLLPPAALNGCDGIDGFAVDLLASTPASIVCVRPPRAFLTWSALCRQAASPAGAADPGRWIAQMEVTLGTVRSMLAARAGSDLHLAVPEQSFDIPAIAGTTPAVVTDTQARVAWTLLCWLDDVTNRGHQPLRNHLLPGVLSNWLPALSTDPNAYVPSTCRPT